MHILLLSVALLVGIIWWRKKVADEEMATCSERRKVHGLSPEEQFRAWANVAAEGKVDLQRWLSSLSDEEATTLSKQLLTAMQSKTQVAQVDKTLKEQ